MQIIRRHILIISLLFSITIPVVSGWAVKSAALDALWLHYPLHSAFIGFGALCSITVAVLLIMMVNSQHILKNYFFVGLALLIMGILHAFHAMLHIDNSFVFLHSIGVMFGGVVLVGVWLPSGWLNNRVQLLLVIVTIITAFTTGISVIALNGSWLEMFAFNNFSNIAINANFIATVGFLAATLFFIKQEFKRKSLPEKTSDKTALFFANYSLIFAISCFMFQFSSIWDTAWWLWHFYQLLASVLALIYIFIELGVLQRQFIENRDQIANMNSLLETKVNERTAELEKASQYKTDFLSRMSHELRTPLNAIIGSAQLIEKDPAVSNLNKTNALQILQSGDHLLALINEILDLSKIEAGKVKMDLTEVSISNLLEECYSVIRPLTDQRHISLKLKTKDCEKLYIKADFIRIKQVILNILSNAVKYNREFGDITIHCELLGDDKVKVNISDTGFGISAENQEKLFQPFSRLGAEYGDQEGTGIGLVIAHKIIELLGGVISVESVPGKGSTFSIEMQTIPAPEIEPSRSRKSEEEGTPYDDIVFNSEAKILLAEDNLTNQHVLKQQLELLGFTDLTFADNGEIALHKWKKNNFDLLMTDISMPLMDGYELSKIIRQEEQGQRKPIIAFSANVFSEDEKRSFASGMDDFIIKPAKLEDLKRVLAKWLPHEKSKNKALEFVVDSKKDDVLDTSMLIEMIGDNKESHCFLLKSFLGSTPDIIEDLKKAYDARLQENITDQAHKLKSSARSIGAHQLADFCEELQHAGENGQWQVIDQQFPRLDNLFEELRDAANDYCKVEWSNQE